jgi:cellulose 1,4-beta-cellobiosidase
LTLQKKLAAEDDTHYSDVATGLLALAQTDVTGLSAATEYSFRYVAVGEGGSTPGAAGTVLTTPAAPAGLSATAGDARVLLSWTASAGAGSYTLERRPQDGGPYTVTVSDLTGTSYTDTGVENGTAYFYVVIASNATGAGAASDQVSATPQAPAAPAAPALSAVTTTGLTATMPPVPARA